MVSVDAGTSSLTAWTKTPVVIFDDNGGKQNQHRQSEGADSENGEEDRKDRVNRHDPRVPGRC